MTKTDLGYYIGYKICESYYQSAKDKKQAIKDILEIKDFNQFLIDSKYEAKFSSARTATAPRRTPRQIRTGIGGFGPSQYASKLTD